MIPGFELGFGPLRLQMAHECHKEQSKRDGTHPHQIELADSQFGIAREPLHESQQSERAHPDVALAELAQSPKDDPGRLSTEVHARGLVIERADDAQFAVAVLKPLHKCFVARVIE